MNEGRLVGKLMLRPRLVDTSRPCGCSPMGGLSRNGSSGKNAEKLKARDRGHDCMLLVSMLRGWRVHCPLDLGTSRDCALSLGSKPKRWRLDTTRGSTSIRHRASDTRRPRKTRTTLGMYYSGCAQRDTQKLCAGMAGGSRPEATRKHDKGGLVETIANKWL